MKQFTLLISVMLISSAVYSTCWRVNSNSQVKAHFTSLQKAIDTTGVQPGDTLYLENGSFFNGVTYLSKRLVIIGPGYFLTEIDSTYANPTSAVINSLQIASGAAQSKLIGIVSNTQITYSNPINNITFERCCLYNGIYSYHYSGGLYLKQCYITGDITGNFSSVYMYNCIINNGKISLLNGDGTFNIINNVIYYNNTGGYYNLAAKNAIVNNNIIIREPVSYKDYCIDYGQSTNSTFSRNILTASTGAANNMLNAIKTDIFMLSGSTDKQFILKTGSPAIGYGINGDDCGAYGGSTPYVPCGLPYLIPRIIHAVIPATTSGSTLPVNLKIKNQEQ